MGAHFKEIKEGSPLVVTNRGAPVVLVEPIQKTLPLFGPPEKQIEEFVAQLKEMGPLDFTSDESISKLKGMDPLDLAATIQLVRKYLLRGGK